MSAPAGLKRLKIGKLLGSGSYASVFVAKDIVDGTKYAVKVIEKEACNDSTDAIQKEISIMTQLEHPNVIRLYNVFETKDKIFIQMELAEGGELFDKLINDGNYTEGDARRIVFSLVSAIQYMHERNIVHRDLKPENILLSDATDQAIIKIADFGLGTMNEGDSLLQTKCGTVSYVSPEVLRGKGYDGKASDMWSVGVITYILLCGYPPFHDEDDSRIMEMTLKGNFSFPDREWGSISANAKDFIKSLIVVDLKKRLTADQALLHPWIASMNDQQIVNESGISIDFGGRFEAKRKLKSSVSAVIFMHKLFATEGIPISPAPSPKLAVADQLPSPASNPNLLGPESYLKQQLKPSNSEERVEKASKSPHLSPLAFLKKALPGFS